MDIKYEIIITDKAKNDLKDIFYYISNSLMAENAANNLMNEFENSILRLENLPKSCSIIEHYKDKKFEYRKLIIKNYIVIYRIDELQNLVYISRIVYGGRNYINEL